MSDQPARQPLDNHQLQDIATHLHQASTENWPATIPACDAGVLASAIFRLSEYESRLPRNAPSTMPCGAAAEMVFASMAEAAKGMGAADV